MVQDGRLAYKLERFDFEGVARFVVSHRENNRSPLAASLYEAYLFSRRKSRKGTSGLILQHLLFLYSWADSASFDLDLSVFSGAGIQLPEILNFFGWLKRRRHKGRELSDSYIAHIVRDCKVFVFWFVKRYVSANEHEALNITIQRAVKAHQEAWAECEINVQYDLLADDINDEDYEIIESYFLQGGLSLDELSDVDLRNYVMWRLAWEFGLRIGEILALRVQDVHLAATPPYLSIVSLDERGENELDPRSPYQPKVKTLSRELGFLFRESCLPRLLEMYIIKLRNRDFLINGKVVKSVFLEHDFLFIVHDGFGQPISCSAVQKISAFAAHKTGVDFKWHLARHAFFNRRYTEASKSSDNSSLIDNLIYWGGWKSSNSLKRYTRRATRDIARSGLIVSNSRSECLAGCKSGKE